VGPFNPVTGELSPAGRCFSDRFGEEICALAEEKPNLVALTAAMTVGTGLDAFAARYPERFTDVGIAEGDAASMAAGMAKQGLVPVFAVYSSFLQRGFDMLIHDVALQQLHVVFCVDRAGLVGSDGETHHGIFDISYLRTVPGMKIFCPASFAELSAMLHAAVCDTPGPVAVRYPRGGECGYSGFRPEKESVLRPGTDLTLVAYGTMVCEAIRAAGMLEERGLSAEVVKLGEVSGEDFPLVLRSLRKTGRLLAAEEVCAAGCVGAALSALAAEQGVRFRAKLLNLGDGIIVHGGRAQLMMDHGIDAASIADRAEELCRERADA
jgi:1-deoxy-D-xylulose-5-phosphate synthase